MDSRPSNQLHWYQTETSAGNTETRGGDTLWSLASLVPLDVTIHHFTISVRPFVKFRGATAALTAWTLTIDEGETGEDPLLSLLVSQHAQTYVLDCLGRTLSGPAHQQAIAEYIDAYDQYVWPRRANPPSNTTAATSVVGQRHGPGHGKTGTARESQSEQHRNTANVAHRFFSARQTLMAVAVTALFSESLTLSESVQQAYLSQTGKATCMTVSFVKDLIVQEPQEQ